VQEDVGERLAPHAPTVHLDDVVLADDGVQLSRGTVDADAPGADQLVGPTPGRDARAGEEGVQAHARIVAMARVAP
jgi:hypothetical protein